MCLLICKARQLEGHRLPSVSIIREFFFINRAMIIISHLLAQCTNVYVLNVAKFFLFTETGAFFSNAFEITSDY